MNGVPHGSLRFVTDFRKVNQCTKTDSYPIGEVLMQVGEDGIDHPISYFSKKFDQRNYSTIEKECLALILALEHFDVYLDTPYTQCLSS